MGVLRLFFSMWSMEKTYFSVSKYIVFTSVLTHIGLHNYIIANVDDMFEFLCYNTLFTFSVLNNRILSPEVHDLPLNILYVSFR